MKRIKKYLSKRIFEQAKNFSSLRNKCKEYLGEYYLKNDKFTIVSHDSYIGFLSEYCVLQYMRETYSKDGFEIKTWNDDFDMNRLTSILNSNDHSEESFDYARKYFYDKYDIKVTYKNYDIFIDVKTALTKLMPNPKWLFMYPTIQAHEEGKDYIILTYYVTVDGKAFGDLEDVFLVGYTSEKKIKNNKIIKKGTINRFGVKSQTDNYITNLSSDYDELDKLFKKIKVLVDKCMEV